MFFVTATGFCADYSLLETSLTPASVFLLGTQVYLELQSPVDKRIRAVI